MKLLIALCCGCSLAWTQQSSTQTVEEKIKTQLNYSWGIKLLQNTNGNLRIVVADARKITELQYITMMQSVGFVLWENKATATFRTIAITNPGGNGFVFQDAPGCKSAMESKDSKPAILAKTKIL